MNFPWEEKPQGWGLAAINICELSIPIVTINEDLISLDNTNHALMETDLAVCGSKIILISSVSIYFENVTRFVSTYVESTARDKVSSFNSSRK